MNKSIKFNAILNAINTIVTMILPLITFPIITRVLGVEEMGRYNFSSSIISYFSLVAGMGIGTYAIREGSRIRDDKEKLGNFVKEIFSLNIYFTVFSLCILFVAIIYIEKLHVYRDIILILSIQIIFTTLGRSWLFIIYEDYLYITIRSIIFQIISVFLIFLLVNDKDDILVYSFISIFSIIGSNIINMICSRSFCRLEFSFRPNINHILPLLLIFGTSVSVVIYGSSDITMLGIWGNDYNVGIYGVGVKIYNIVKQLLATVLTVAIPRFSFYLGKKNHVEYNKLFSDIYNILLLIVLPTTVGLLMISKSVVIILAGNEFESSYIPLSILCLSIIFNLIAYMYGYCVLIPNKKEKVFFIATLVSAIVNILLNFIMIPLYYQIATAITTIISELIAMLICIRGAKGLVKFEINKRNLICIIIGCIWVMIVCVFANILFENHIVITLISVGFSGVGYFIIQILLRNSICIQGMHELLRIKK